MNADSKVLEFCGMLRRAGLRLDIERQSALFEALTVIPASGLYAVFLAGRTTLCASPEDVVRYDACFARFFFDNKFPTCEILPDPKASPMVPGATDIRSRETSGDDDDREMMIGAASQIENLRRRKLSTLSSEEKTQIYTLIARLRGGMALMRGRRQLSASRGSVDVRRTVKAAISQAGEVSQILTRTKRPRVRKRVLLLDISGSMAPFAPGLLRFGYAAHRGAPRRTEVFTVGTRLTRVSRHFETSDPERGVVSALQAVPDWSGGTRLGDQLKAFLDIWGQRGMARGAIVVIASDGWERGGADILGAQMQRLRRLAHKIIWANPHKSTPGFEPLTAGMQAALPAVDEFVAGSSADELALLIKRMGLG